MLPDLHTGFSRGTSGGLVFPSLEEFSTVYCDPHSQRFGIVKKAEIDVFLELFCFFNDLADVGNLISGSSTFSKIDSMSPQTLIPKPDQDTANMILQANITDKHRHKNPQQNTSNLNPPIH